MARYRLLRDFFSVLDSAEPASRLDTIDEYRELAMLAYAWERRSLKQVGEGASGRVDDAKVKESAL